MIARAKWVCLPIPVALMLGTVHPMENGFANSHAQSLFRVSGRMERHVDYERLTAALRERLYRECRMTSNQKEFPLVFGDVVTFGAAHSAFAGREPWLRRLWVLGWIGDRGFLQGVLAGMPESERTNVRIWRRPEGLGLIASRGSGQDDLHFFTGNGSREGDDSKPVLGLFENEYVFFKAKLRYARFFDQEPELRPEECDWEPRKVFTRPGLVDGADIEQKGVMIVVRHKQLPELEVSVILEKEPRPSICGLWDWFNQGTVNIEGSPENGRMRQTAYDGSLVNEGTWRNIDPREGVYELRWAFGGWVDILQMSRDGRNLAGLNNRRHPVTGKRMNSK